VEVPDSKPYILLCSLVTQKQRMWNCASKCESIHGFAQVTVICQRSTLQPFSSQDAFRPSTAFSLPGATR